MMTSKILFVLLCSILINIASFCQTHIANGSFTGSIVDGRLGDDVDIDGNWAIAGAPDSGNGEVRIYKRDPNNGVWSFAKKIFQNDGQVDDFFGSGLAINDNIIIVGARGDDDQANRNGSAYVFYKDLGGFENWGLLKKLEASDASANSFFGNSVDIDNGIAIIGTFSIGKAYVFGKDQGGTDNWGEIKQLVREDPASFNNFGKDVAIHNELVVVGASSDDIPNNNQGSAYIFSKNKGGSNNWGQVVKLQAPDGNAEDLFGSSVSIHGNEAVIGAPDNSELSNSFFRGAAYIYSKNEGGIDNWGFLKKLKQDISENGGQFGWDVAIFGDAIIVGALNADEITTDDGAAYLFKRNSGGSNNWGQVQKLLAPGSVSTADAFGTSVHLSHGKIIVSAFRNDNGGTNVGSIYFFEEQCNVTNISITNANLSSTLGKQLFTATTAITANASFDNYLFYGLKAGNNLTFSAGTEIANGTEMDMQIDFCPN